jgi:hypothetical protein
MTDELITVVFSPHPNGGGTVAYNLGRTGVRGKSLAFPSVEDPASVVSGSRKGDHEVVDEVEPASWASNSTSVKLNNHK